MCISPKDFTTCFIQSSHTTSCSSHFPFNLSFPSHWNSTSLRLLDPKRFCYTSRLGKALSPLRFSFCEEKYHVNLQFAESANTLTNLLYKTLAIRGICRIRSSWLLYLILALVGFASFWNHDTSFGGTDCGPIVHELPIRYTLLLQHHHHSSDYKASFKNLSAVASGPGRPGLRIVVAFCCLTSYNAGIHQLSFAFVCVASAGILIYRTFRLNSTATKAKFRKLQAIGRLSIIIEYVLWNLDFALCRTLRTWRQDFGLPYGLLLQFHGWWHIFTAVSGTCYIEMVEGLWREEEKTRQLGLPTWTAAGTTELLSEKVWVRSTGGFCWVGRN